MCDSFAFVLLVAGFDFGRKRRQGLVPKLVEPLPQRAEPVGVDVVDAAGALGPVPHQARLLQDLEMLRYRRAADRQAPRDGADRPWSRLEPPQHAPAGPP